MASDLVPAPGAGLAVAAQRLAARLCRDRLKVGAFAPELNDFSIFDGADKAEREEVLRLARSDPAGERAIGCMVGMAVADSVGHNFEFLPAGEPGHRFDPVTLKITGAFNKFNL